MLCMLINTRCRNDYIRANYINIIVPTQVKNMRAELASLNHCAVPFLSCAAADSNNIYSIVALCSYVSLKAVIMFTEITEYVNHCYVIIIILIELAI